jgi:hypothetical protein
MPRCRVALLVAVLALVPTRMPAQVQVGISGFGGIYLPTADMFAGVVPIENVSIPAVSVDFGQKTGFALGGRVAVWPTTRIGIEAEAAYSPSNVKLNILGSVFSGDYDASVFLGSLNLMWAFIRPPLEPLSIYVSGGVGFVSRGGSFYDEVGVESTADLAGVAGLGLKYGLARGLWVRFDVRDYISSYQDQRLTDAALTGGGAKLQNDLLILVSLEYFLNTGY